jgi:SOS-response transcriptional repressor LexA
MDVIDRLNAVVQASRKSRKEIARDAGMSASKLTRLLRRQNRACVEDVEAVLRALDLTMQSLYAGDIEVDVRVALRALTDYVDRHEPKSLAKPKRAATRVARPFEVAATPNVIVFDARQKSRIRIPDDLWDRGARYAAKVVGDSMVDAGIEHGAIVYFRRSTTKRPPRGAIVIIKVNRQDYLKRYDEAGGERRLLSENAGYRKMVLKPSDEVELIGIVVRPTSES